MITVDDLIGLPYVKGARGPTSYDCYGLCMEVTKRAGIEIPDWGTPVTRKDRNVAFFSRMQDWEKIAKPVQYCLTVYKIKRNWHAGVVLPGLDTFIHVTAGINVTVSQLNNFKWRQRFNGFYTFPTDENS